MSKVIEAIYRQGQIELPPDMQLPENTRVTVIVPDRAEEDVTKEHLRQALAASGRVTVPEPYTSQESYERHTPVPITGEPVSDIIIEQRGPR